ncbi:hypothetical protein CUJ83_04320 [Methanocella sp. CWC-04]|uniref:Uncharacterized protein n=1 Tax=Methanooceanicella nereidis TaxID=2052831 RepID=A0AAP2RDT3_9EURY|nr:hypothetical protein [Methanocella sp. CWC-04]MCD1294220.1 hypothetical protein [Methanocella sp. CWC-04]
MDKAGKDRVRTAAVLAMFLVMIYFGYFLSLQTSLDEARKYLPDIIDDEVGRILSRLPEESRDNMGLPLPEIKYQADLHYNRIVSEGEFRSTEWILNNTDRSEKFIADIFSAELIMGMTTRASSVGGDWANAPDPVGKMANTTEIYKTDSAGRANMLARSENANYIFVPSRALYTGWRVPCSEINFTKFDDTGYFEKLYCNENVTIYRVL